MEKRLDWLKKTVIGNDEVTLKSGKKLTWSEVEEAHDAFTVYCIRLRVDLEVKRLLAKMPPQERQGIMRPSESTLEKYAKIVFYHWKDNYTEVEAARDVIAHLSHERAMEQDGFESQFDIEEEEAPFIQYERD